MRPINSRFLTTLITILFIGTVVTPTIAVALTEESDLSPTVQSTEDIAKGQQTVQSTTESALQTNNESIDEFEETIESSSEPTIEEHAIEENYEDRELADTMDQPSVHPIVQLETKELTDTLKIKGKLTIKDEETTRTVQLKKVALQMKTTEEDWTDQKDFTIEETFELSNEDFSFEHEDQIEEVQDLRLIVDYEVIDHSDESVIKIEKHKGSYLMGETSISEPVVQGPILETPEYFAAPRGIQPRGANVVYGDSNAANGSLFGNNYTGHYLIFHSISSRTAKLNYQSNRSMVSTVDGRDFYFVWSTDPNYAVRNADASNSVKATRYDIQYSGSSSKWIYFRNVPVTNLLPSTTYYVWICFSSSGSLTKASSVSNFDRKTDMKFTTDGPIALGLTAPTFTQASTTATSIPMVGKAYTGDPFQTNTQGKVQVTPDDGTTIQDKVTNLGHTKTQGGTYNNVTVPGLAAGTRYKGRVAIKDYVGTWKYSGWSGYFYTANTANQPAAPTLNNPTAANNATAAVSATYVAGNVAAHPTATEVQISTNNSSWTTINTGTTPATTNPVINTGTKAVTFSLSKLNAKTRYYVRYRVRNASNVWSAYSASRDFTTKGIQLVLDPPVFTSANTHNTVTLGSSGYTGDISTAATDGILEMTSNTSLTAWGSKLTNVQHATGRGTTAAKGKVNDIAGGRQITGLTAGTKYQARLKIKDYGTTGANGAQQTSGVATVYTKNSLTNPVLAQNIAPTATTPASATFTATYGYNSVAALAAHPTSARVRVNTGSGWGADLSATTTPAVQVTTLANGQVAFTLTKLASKQNYQVAYCLINAGGTTDWAFLQGSSFDTKGIQPVVSPPVFTQTTATPTSIYMEGGTYTGDLSATPNHGIIQTESYNSGGVKDWTARVTNLAHNPTFNTYSGSLVTGLTPGTRYRGWVAFKEYGTNGTYSYVERNTPNATPYYFYTTNSINNLTAPTQGIPTMDNDATATFTAGYQAAGDHTAQVAAHPTKVKVFLSTDGTNFNEVTTGSAGLSIVRDDDINTSAKTITFKLTGLRENTRYYVKYSVVNVGGESPESSIYDFTTLSRPAGFYLNEVPTAFNFGVIDLSGNQLSHSLHQSTGETFIDFENINVNTQWTVSAKLSELKANGEPHLKLAGSSILLNKQLKKTTDSGSTWNAADTSKFDSSTGTSGLITLPAGASTSVDIFKTNDITYGKGHFRNEIPLDSVKLLVPGHTGEEGKLYEGKITWTLDTTL